MSSEWAVKKVAEIASRARNALVGGPFGSNLVASDYVETGVPVIRGQNMAGRWVGGDFAYVTHEKAQSLEANLARPADIVFTQRGTLGQVALVPEEPFETYLISQSQMKLTVDRDNAEPLFFYYQFQSPTQQEYIRQHAIQVGVPHTNLGILRETPVVVPPIVEQRAIAHILGTLDDKIELNRRMNETLDAVARAIFRSWFVDFDPVRAKVSGEPPESICHRFHLASELLALFPDRLVDSELGQIPKGWQIARLGNVVNVVDYVANGSFASLKENVQLLTAPGYALFVRTTDFNSNFKGGFRFVTEPAYKFLAKSALDGSEVIISNVGDVGTVFRPPKWLGWPMTLGSNAVALKTKNTPNYFFQYFKDPVGQSAIASLVTGSAQPKFNKTNLRDLFILLPPVPILHIFETLTEGLWKKESHLRKEAETLAALRDALLPKLLSGNLRVQARGGV
jgi:type I restriction enzyme, S subunit